MRREQGLWSIYSILPFISDLGVHEVGVHELGVNKLKQISSIFKKYKNALSQFMKIIALKYPF